MFALLATTTVKSYVEGKTEVTLNKYIASTAPAMKSYEESETSANKVMGTYVSTSFLRFASRPVKQSVMVGI